MKKKVISACAILLTLLYPCLFMYFQNIDEAHFGDMTKALSFFLVLSIICFIGGSIVIHNFVKSALFTCISLLWLMNFHILFKKVNIPTIVILGFMAILSLTLAILFRLKIKESVAYIFVQFWGICFSCLILLNLICAAPTMIRKASFQKQTISAIESSGNSSASLPNVYYFIFDEYGGTECLNRYYNYDNTGFLNDLRNRNFSVSDNSINVESVVTTVNIPNLLNLDYVASAGEVTDNNLKYLTNPKLFQIFQSNGYTINMINHNGFLDPTGCNVIFSSKQTDDISYYILQNSIYANLESYLSRNSVVSGELQTYYELFLSTFYTLEHSYDYVDAEHPTLTIAYIASPHVPFVIDINGNPASLEHTQDWENQSYYLEQLQYTNQRMEATVDTIIAKDPDAIIILQSDHGARYPNHIRDKYPDQTFGAEEYPYIKNILNCVYFGGEDIQIDGLTGINTLREIVNRLFDMNYEYIYRDELINVE